MGWTYRRLTDYDSIHNGIDLWDRVHPEFVIPDRLVAQNSFASFTGLDVTVCGGFSGDDPGQLLPGFPFSFEPWTKEVSK